MELIDLAWEIFNNPIFVQLCSFQGLIILVFIIGLIIFKKGKLKKPKKEK